MTIKIFLAFSVLISVAYAESIVDFCVADLSLRITPAGYPCKNVSQVAVDDFTSSDLGVKGNIFPINYLKATNFNDCVNSLIISTRSVT